MSRSKPLPPVERLRSLLDYDPLTGLFTWLVSRSTVKAGQVAGSVNTPGYVVIRIFGKDYLAHRLAWLHVHGIEPADEIDHINGLPADNRWANLRAATHAENIRNSRLRKNNKSGAHGVWLRNDTKKWAAQIVCNGKPWTLGSFETREEALLARANATCLLFGEFRRREVAASESDTLRREVADALTSL